MRELLATEWRDIPGFPGYQASKCGLIMSLDRFYSVRRRILKQTPNSGGYLRVSLYVKGKQFKRSVAHLIYMTWARPNSSGNGY